MFCMKAVKYVMCIIAQHVYSLHGFMDDDTFE